MSTFGERLIESRKKKNITQKDLAKIIGVKHNSVSNWENDKCKPDVDTIEVLCGVLDISPSYLLGNDNIKKDMPIYDSNIIELIDLFSSLSAYEKTAILTILRKMNS